jgi:tetratricopeptide (TPR) repeat protein
LALAVAAVVLAVHWPVLSAQALSFDDGQFLTNNPLVRHPSWTSAGRFLAEVLEPSTVEGYYLPLSMISLMLDCAAGGRPDNLAPFHRTSLALHAANTVLVIVLLYGLFGRPWPAAMAGLLLGVHPLTVEPVAWVGERKTLLAAFFALWCLILYVRHARRGGRGSYAASLVCYVLAVMSKPTALPLPVVLLLMDFWPLGWLDRSLALPGRGWIGRRELLNKLPFVAVAISFAVISFISHGRTAGFLPSGRRSVLDTAVTMAYLMVFYLGKIVWPTNLTSVYALPEPFALSNPAVLGGVIGTGVLVGALLLSLRRTRALLTGSLIFFAAMLPTLGLVRYSWITASDKYVYLPAVGLLLILAWLLDRAWATRVPVRAVLAVVLLLAVGAEANAARGYLECWRDTETLFRRMVRLAPNAHMPHYDLGHCLQSQGRLAEAESEYRAAIRIQPEHADSHNNLGLVLVNTGRPDEAVEHYRAALRARPRHPAVLVNLGTVLGDTGRLDEAIERFRQAVDAVPRDPRAHNGLGTVLYRQGRFDDAVTAYRKALDIDPRHLPALKNLGLALVALGRNAQAVDTYREAIRLDPSDPYLHNNCGVALNRLGRRAEAAEEYRQALRLKPDYPDAHKNLGVMLALQGVHDEAAREFRAVLAITPADAEAANRLGDVLFEQKKYAEAADAYRAATRCEPTFAEAYRNLGVALACLSRLDEAVEAYRAALRLVSDDAATRNNLGSALLDLGRAEEAAVECREALRLKPDFAAAHFNLAAALAKLGRTQEAIAEYRAVLRLDPNDAEARARVEALRSAED